MAERDGRSGSRRAGRTAGWRSHRGAVLVEAAFVLPVVLTLLLGVIEFGFIWKDELTITSAVRSASRMASSDGAGASADYDVLQQVKSGTTALPSGAIQKIIVYKANTSSTVPPLCVSSGSQTGVCNVYTAADLARPKTDFDCATDSTAPDHSWCPSTRVDVQATPPDYVGVYLLINHAYVTKILGTSRTLADQAVLRIEPTS